MDMKKIVIAGAFVMGTGGTTYYASTGPGLETYTRPWLVTDKMTRDERQAAIAAARTERQRTNPSYYGGGSIRTNSGGNSRYRGRVK